MSKLFYSVGVKTSLISFIVRYKSILTVVTLHIRKAQTIAQHLTKFGKAALSVILQARRYFE